VYKQKYLNNSDDFGMYSNIFMLGAVKKRIKLNLNIPSIHRTRLTIFYTLLKMRLKIINFFIRILKQ